MTRTRTLKLSVLAAASALAMSACSAHPGSAAVVGSESIGGGRLDEVASALCSAQGSAAQSSQPQELASRAARQGALDVLINGSTSRQFGESQGVEADQEQLASAVDANKATIAKLPADRRTVFRETLVDYATGQLMLGEIGKNELEKQGTSNATAEQAVAAGTKLRDAWVEKNLKVSVDPRYGTFSKGALVAKSGSLSAAVSADAVDGAAQAPSSSWVSSLPASQKCS